MLECLPVAQEQGRRRRIAVEPTSGRVLPRGRPVHPARRPLAPFPPPALSDVWAPWKRCHPPPPRARAVFRLGPQLGRRNRARAPCAWLGQIPPGPPELKSFSFSFFSLFSFNYYISIFYGPKITKYFLKSHEIIILENDTLQLVNHY
jgi:hypothetical protein